jgi:hypothetical protein
MFWYLKGSRSVAATTTVTVVLEDGLLVIHGMELSSVSETKKKQSTRKSIPLEINSLQSAAVSQYAGDRTASPHPAASVNFRPKNGSTAAQNGRLIADIHFAAGSVKLAKCPSPERHEFLQTLPFLRPTSGSLKLRPPYRGSS